MRRTQLHLLLGLLATLGLLALVSFSAGGEQSRMANAGRAQQARAIEKGADLYDQHCRSCHGINGEGVGLLGPSLNDAHFFTARLGEVGWAGTLADYVAVTTAMGRVTATRPRYVGDGTVAMPPWSQEFGGPLRPDEIQSVTAFVLNWQATALGEYTSPPVPTPTPNPKTIAERITTGRQLFVETGCAGCHRVDGLSDVAIGPDLSAIGQTAPSRVERLTADAYLRESVLLPDAYVVEGYKEGSGCGGVLSQSQLDALVAYLLTLGID